MKKYLTFILILCILCQCALFSISTNAEEIIAGDIQTEEMQFATLEEVLAGLATPDQLPPDLNRFKPDAQYSPLVTNTGLNLDGIYYINNTYGGVYLSCSTSSSVAPDGKSGLLNTLGNTIKWMVAEVTDGSGIYTIRPMTAYSKYLTFAPGNVYATLSTTLNDYSKWYIRMADHGGILIQNAGSGRYLQSYGDTSFDGTADIMVLPSLPASTNATYNSYAWRIISHSSYGTSSGYEKCEMSAQTRINDLECNIGIPKKPTITKQYTNETWCEASDFWYSIDSQEDIISVDLLTGRISGHEMGLYYVIAEHKVTGETLSFLIHIDSLLIYQSPNTYYQDEDGNYPEDIMYGDKTKDEICDIDGISLSDFANQNYYRSTWESMCTTVFANDYFDPVIMDMIDHFMEGSGQSYSHPVLSEAAKEHESTQTYIAAVKTRVKNIIDTNNGDVSLLKYDIPTRESHPLVISLKDINQPVFNTNADKAEGLLICVHGLWGNEIKLVAYHQDNDTYYGTLRFILYDHFGLDQADVEKFEYFNGFRYWYILQHYDQYDGAHKPFLTLMEFDIPFSKSVD